VIGPYVIYLLLPILTASGIILAAIMALSRLWQRGGDGRSVERG